MSRRFIHNYLRSFRKRAGLTQDEAAFLLGCQCGTKVSRYETCTRLPSLATGFACQAMYRAPLHEIFPGMYTVVEQQVKRRALVLGTQLEPEEDDLLVERKRAFLLDLERGAVRKVRPELWENPKQLRLFSL